MRNPAAVSLISMPRSPYSADRRSSASWISCAEGRTFSSNRAARSAGCKGLPAASSAASITFLMYDSLMSDPRRRRFFLVRIVVAGFDVIADCDVCVMACCDVAYFRIIDSQLADCRLVRLQRLFVVSHDAQCAVRGRGAHMQWRKRLGLHDIDEALAHELQNRDKRDRDAHPALLGAEQAHEFYETRAFQCGKD